METLWTILGPAESTPSKLVAECQCGTIRVIGKSDFENGRTRSCGCIHGRGKSPEQRLRGRITVTANGCWECSGSGSNGYATITVDGKSVLTHRLAWTLWVGPIPDGLELDHLCRNQMCCNPEHLEPVTHAENVRRGVSIAAQHAAKTTCPRGHEYDRVVAGRRRCSICIKDIGRRSQARRRAARADS